jgi:hypothetical protein
MRYILDVGIIISILVLIVGLYLVPKKNKNAFILLIVGFIGLASCVFQLYLTGQR